MATKTSPLKVIGDVAFPMGRIVINPNDGYDLGLLTSAIPVRIHGTVTSASGETSRGYLFDGQLMQENNCKIGTVLVCLKFLQQLGKPQYIQLHLDGPNLIIARQGA